MNTKVTENLNSLFYPYEVSGIVKIIFEYYNEQKIASFSRQLEFLGRKIRTKFTGEMKDMSEKYIAFRDRMNTLVIFDTKGNKMLTNVGFRLDFVEIIGDLVYFIDDLYNIKVMNIKSGQLIKQYSSLHIGHTEMSDNYIVSSSRFEQNIRIINIVDDSVKDVVLNSKPVSGFILNNYFYWMSDIDWSIMRINLNTFIEEIFIPNIESLPEFDIGDDEFFLTMSYYKGLVYLGGTSSIYVFNEETKQLVDNFDVGEKTASLSKFSDTGKLLIETYEFDEETEDFTSNLYEFDSNTNEVKFIKKTNRMSTYFYTYFDTE